MEGGMPGVPAGAPNLGGAGIVLAPGAPNGGGLAPNGNIDEILPASDEAPNDGLVAPDAGGVAIDGEGIAPNIEDAARNGRGVAGDGAIHDAAGRAPPPNVGDVAGMLAAAGAAAPGGAPPQPNAGGGAAMLAAPPLPHFDIDRGLGVLRLERTHSSSSNYGEDKLLSWKNV